MVNRILTYEDLICESHVGLERQGPGSPEMTIKALSFLENKDKFSRTADLGCGTGGQTIVLAQNISGDIFGVDQFPVFINAFNDRVKKQNLQDRVRGIIGEMEHLPFRKEEFDLIWSEGAIDNIGFENGLSYWKKYLKKQGYIAVTCPSWLTDKHPAEVEKFWSNALCDLETIKNNMQIMQKVGYTSITSFTLPEKCWTDNYFTPRTEAEKRILALFPDNKAVEMMIENSKHEVKLYKKYKKYYGYVFYIGRKE